MVFASTIKARRQLGMLRTISGIYDGEKLELAERIKIRGKANVLVTFLDEPETIASRNAAVDRLLSRKPIRIAPLKVKALIEAGRR
jgi:hypothetical protein